MNKHKRFGLVFEEHLPECTPLHGIPVKAGSKVARKTGNINELYQVLAIREGKALCLRLADQEKAEIEVQELVCAAQFGEPIYPYLKPMASVCRAPDSDLWHTLIEADNYHALQLLEYLYAGKVDCIYIDPPYNTGAKDWKYNNNYVDSSDTYRHSKWLSMMQKRLRLAKKLLNPQNSVLIVTIDEKEYLHLGCLLEEMFPEANTQMISSIINPAGVSRNGAFARVDEYIYVVQIGASEVYRLELTDEWRIRPDDKRALRLRWNTLIRTGTNARRVDRENQFYPVFVYEDGHAIHSVGEPYYGTDRNEIVPPEGTVAIWPIRSGGEEGRWQVSNDVLRELAPKGYVHLGRFTENGMAISYLKRGEIQKIESGAFEISGYAEDGSVISDTEATSLIPGTQWRISSHDATLNGTKLLQGIIGARFSFPKSLYAVHDAIHFFVKDKPDALIVDFFAGSGTTLHAVNLLNAEDGGRRRCILVTNNEVSADEAKTLSAQGFRPGDAEWEKLGIARYVTWPRTVCSIEGRDVNGQPLKGNYLGSDLPMAEGFRTNAAFFKLGFLDKTSVQLGSQFQNLLPVLWMKAGAIGPCPTLNGETLPDMVILPQNRFAVLLEETSFADFESAVNGDSTIETVYIVTDYEAGYRAMSSSLRVKRSYQLYRDYLDNFRINQGRDSI